MTARENAETADLVRDRDEWQRVAAQRGEELGHAELEMERLRVWVEAATLLMIRAERLRVLAGTDVGIRMSRLLCEGPGLEASQLHEEVERLRGEPERERSAADQYRERLNVSEQALCDQRTLSQSIGNRLDELFRAADTACRVWERNPSASLHEIRTTMRALRQRLNAPNGWRSELKELQEQELTPVEREYLEYHADAPVPAPALDAVRAAYPVQVIKKYQARAESAETKLAAVWAMLHPGTPQFAFQIVKDIRALLAPSQGEAQFRCGSCRDTGKWSTGIVCPVCGGASVAPSQDEGGGNG